MSSNRPTYRELVEKTKPHAPPPRTAETELDALLNAIKERENRAKETAKPDAPDPIQLLRELTVRELIPIFVELVEKYAKSGISMQMDASSLLEGGREMAFEFGLGDYRIQLQGTVTSDAIAFHEIRYTPETQGQLAAGPMLRLRQLDAKTFREFVCERLTVLLRFAARRR